MQWRIQKPLMTIALAIAIAEEKSPGRELSHISEQTVVHLA
jgi:hypothetical protein